MILVTGGNGFLGSEVVKQLKGNCIVGNRLNCDVTCVNMMDRLFKKHKITQVIHCAEVVKGGQEKHEHINLIGTENLINVCKKHNIHKIIYPVSIAIDRQVSYYGFVKLVNKEKIIDSGLNYSIIKIPAIYDEKQGSLHTFDKFLKKFKFVPIFGEGIIRQVHKKEAARVLIQELDNPFNTQREMEAEVVYLTNKYMGSLKVPIPDFIVKVCALVLDWFGKDGWLLLEHSHRAGD